jgi:hypothetical protein
MEAMLLPCLFCFHIIMLVQMGYLYEAVCFLNAIKYLSPRVVRQRGVLPSYRCFLINSNVK